jgi:hypothetical protein
MGQWCFVWRESRINVLHTASTEGRQTVACRPPSFFFAKLLRHAVIVETLRQQCPGSCAIRER